MHVGTRTDGRVCFFRAEGGIRDRTVTGVQTCALPICPVRASPVARVASVNFDVPLRHAQGVTPGLGAYLDGNIIWNCATNFENVYVNDPTYGTTQLTVNRCILSGPDFVGNGVGNLAWDPRLVNTNAATITAATLRSALAWRPGSPG